MDEKKSTRLALREFSELETKTVDAYQLDWDVNHENHRRQYRLESPDLPWWRTIAHALIRKTILDDLRKRGVLKDA